MPHFEYDKDYPFAAFITNLGKYNEGDLVGEWVKFPTTAEEMKEVFRRIGIGQKDDFGQTYEEWFITDYDCYVDGLYDKLGEYENLDELNYLASKLDEMSQSEYAQFQAGMELGDHCGSLQEIINLTENLDCYEIYPDIEDYDDLGRYYIEELDVMQVPEHLKNYIDYEAYGRDVAIDENGTFTDQGYVRDTGDRFCEYYDGERGSIPEEYRVMTFQEESELTEDEKSEWAMDSVDKTNQTYTIGDSALTLNAKATGGESGKPITYKLIAKKDGTETVKASATVAASSTEGFSAPLRFTETGSYECWFEATRGGVTISSDVFEVTVSAPGLSITNQSGDLTVKQGATARLFVKAVGHGVNYQWQVKNGETWEAISGETDYDYAAPTTDVGENTYRCVVTDKYGATEYSNEMTVTVTEVADSSLTPAILLAAVNGDAPDPAELWPDKDVTPNGWLSLTAEYNVTAGETCNGVATFSTIPTGFNMNGHDIYYDSYNNIQKTPVLGTISYEWEGTTKNPWEATSGDFTSLGTDAHASFTIPSGVNTYYVIITGANRLFLFLNGHLLQIGDFSLDRLDCLYLVNRLNVHRDNQAGFHIEEISKHTVVQFGSEDLQKRDRTELFTNTEVLTVPKLKGAWSDKVLYGKSGRSKPIPREVEISLFIHVKHPVHKGKTLFAVQGFSSYAKSLEVIEQIGLNTVKAGLCHFHCIRFNAEG